MDHSGRFAIALFRGTGFVSWAIRLQTRGDYSHAALLVPDGCIIEAVAGGVRERPLGPREQVDIFEVPSATLQQWLTALDFARAQLGKPYDYLSVLRFISRRPAAGRDSWFCSELAFGSLWNAGVHLLERVPPWAVSPAHLSHSPLLRLAHAGVARRRPQLPAMYRAH